MASPTQASFVPPENFGRVIYDTEGWSAQEYVEAQAESERLRGELFLGPDMGLEDSEAAEAERQAAYDTARMKETLLYIAAKLSGQLDGYASDSPFGDDSV